jgi:hypothetical protein
MRPARRRSVAGERRPRAGHHRARPSCARDNRRTDAVDRQGALPAGARLLDGVLLIAPLLLLEQLAARPCAARDPFVEHWRRAAGQLADRGLDVDPLHARDEIDHIAVNAAAEAVIGLILKTTKLGVLSGMEWAAADLVRCRRGATAPPARQSGSRGYCARMASKSYAITRFRAPMPGSAARNARLDRAVAQRGHDEALTVLRGRAARDKLLDAGEVRDCLHGLLRKVDAHRNGAPAARRWASKVSARR